MTDTPDLASAAHADARAPALVLEYRLDAPPGKVWRALSIPELREHWLPGSGDARTLSAQPPCVLELALREAGPPFAESTVRFALRPDAAGGTLLTIEHAMAPQRRREAANDGGLRMRLRA